MNLDLDNLINYLFLLNLFYEKKIMIFLLNFKTFVYLSRSEIVNKLKFYNNVQNLPQFNYLIFNIDHIENKDLSLNESIFKKLILLEMVVCKKPCFNVYSYKLLNTSRKLFLLNFLYFFFFLCYLIIRKN